MTVSPFYAAAVISAYFQAPPSIMPRTGWTLFWSFFYAIAALALLVATLASFNRCLGRVETGHTRSAERGWGPVRGS